jgi:hypothetical protein
MRELSWTAWKHFNIIKSLILYGFIFLLLGTLALYVSKELPSVVASKNIHLLGTNWIADPASAIDALIFGISAVLLLMAWLNAAITILVAIWRTFAIIAALIAKLFCPPLRWVFRHLHSLATQIRERHRDKLFAAEMAAHAEHMEAFIATKADTADFGPRLKLFDAVTIFDSGVWVAHQYFGYGIIGTLSDETSEYRKVHRAYGLTDVWRCCRYLKILAHRAPIEFFSEDAWKLHKKLEQCVELYEVLPEDTLLARMQKCGFGAHPLGEVELQWAQEAIRARLKNLYPERTRSLESKWI